MELSNVLAWNSFAAAARGDDRDRLIHSAALHDSMLKRLGERFNHDLLLVVRQVGKDREGEGTRIIFLRNRIITGA